MTGKGPETLDAPGSNLPAAALGLVFWKLACPHWTVGLENWSNGFFCVLQNSVVLFDNLLQALFGHVFKMNYKTNAQVDGITSPFC